MKRALITGVTGQDGSYLSEFLLEKGYEVHGVVRRSSNVNTSRIEHLYVDKHEENSKFFLHYGDLSDPFSLDRLIRNIHPHEIYNLAAQSHVQVSFELPNYTSTINSLGNLNLLEIVRNFDNSIKFYQASTSELFGSTPPPQSEESQFKPRSPYANSKLMAYWTTINYREAYGIHASNGILFNHESPRRGITFVTRKISRAAAAIKLGRQSQLYLGNLEAIRDWGYAKEYVETMWKMLQQDQPGDYAIATGVGATVRQFAQKAFESVDLELEKYLKIDSNYFRKTEVESLIGNSEKAQQILGWTPKTMWPELSKLMVEFDMKQLSE